MSITSYLIKSLSTANEPEYGRQKTVETAVRLLRQLDFDTIVVRGTSGLVLGPIVAYLLNKKLCVIRKGVEGVHTTRLVEFENNIGKYVILDDLIDSGSTVKTINEKINEVDWRAQWVAVYLYERFLKEPYAHRYLGDGVKFNTYNDDWATCRSVEAMIFENREKTHEFIFSPPNSAEKTIAAELQFQEDGSGYYKLDIGEISNKYISATRRPSTKKEC